MGFLVASITFFGLLLVLIKSGAIYVAGHEIKYSTQPILFFSFCSAYFIIASVLLVLAFV